MGAIIFRKARTSDLPVLNMISYEAKSHWGYPKEWMEHWREDLTMKEADLQNEHVLLIEIDKEIGGFCSLNEKEARAEVSHLWILPKYMGRGYGGLLLSKALSTLSGEKTISVVADPNAEPFYQKQGFRTIDQIESFPKGRFLPLMEKSILQTEKN